MADTQPLQQRFHRDGVGLDAAEIVVRLKAGIPGLGRLLVDAIFARDYPVIQGCMLFVAFTYVLVNLVIDLCYPVFDPRVTAQ